MAALRHEAADDAAENDDQSDDDIHASPPELTLIFVVRNTVSALREPVPNRKISHFDQQVRASKSGQSGIHTGGFARLRHLPPGRIQMIGP
jgi:hypothetical protein